MNRLIFFFVAFFLCIGFKSIDTKIKVQSVDNDVILNYSKSWDLVYGIKIPIKVEIINESMAVEEFMTIDYNYHPYQKGVGEEVYYEKNDLLNKIDNNKKKILNPNNTKEYLVYSRYRIDRFDKQNEFQKQLRSYVETMLKQNKDTLHIGTVSEFKKNHKELFERLTKNDSISVQFLDGKKLGKRIAIPVRW